MPDRNFYNDNFDVAFYPWPTIGNMYWLTPEAATNIASMLHGYLNAWRMTPEYSLSVAKNLLPLSRVCKTFRESMRQPFDKLWVASFEPDEPEADTEDSD